MCKLAMTIVNFGAINHQYDHRTDTVTMRLKRNQTLVRIDSDPIFELISVLLAPIVTKPKR